MRTRLVFFNLIHHNLNKEMCLPKLRQFGHSVTLFIIIIIRGRTQYRLSPVHCNSKCIVQFYHNNYLSHTIIRGMIIYFIISRYSGASPPILPLCISTIINMIIHYSGLPSSLCIVKYIAYHLILTVYDGLLNTIKWLSLHSQEI